MLISHEYTCTFVDCNHWITGSVLGGCYSCKYVEDVFRLNMHVFILRKTSLLHYHSKQKIFRLKISVYYHCILFQCWKSKQHDTLYQQRQRQNQLLMDTILLTLILQQVTLCSWETVFKYNLIKLGNESLWQNKSWESREVIHHIYFFLNHTLYYSKQSATVYRIMIRMFHSIILC